MNIRAFIKQFRNRAGASIFSATVLSRGFSFLGSWIAYQFIDEKELGVALFAFTIVNFLMPLTGLGLEQSLLRYATLTKDQEEKERLYHFTVKKGAWLVVLQYVLTVLISFLIPFEFSNTPFYLAVLGLIFISYYYFELLQIRFRLFHQNDLFAQAEKSRAFLQILFISFGSYFFGAIGFVSSFVLSSFITWWIFKQKIKEKKNKNQPKTLINRKYWSYGLFASLAGVATQLILSVDILMIGEILKDPEQVTYYRYAILLPFSLIFIPQVVSSTDFVLLTERIQDRKYIRGYIRSFMKLMSGISIGVILFFFFLGRKLLELIGPEMPQFFPLLMIISFGVVSVLIFRVFFSNMLSALGKMHVNFYINMIGIGMNIILNFLLIPKYGILGASITSTSVMWLTSLITYFWFRRAYANGSQGAERLMKVEKND
ncbi:MAG: polysaccharide biosynthesis C-terminal domain-containing protein [Flavobacteriales bacterium]|nr:polysaccharide biosynthesis C-terminal domain-containing protein [Flavobacteriales bacterium]